MLRRTGAAARTSTYLNGRFELARTISTEAAQRSQRLSLRRRTSRSHNAGKNLAESYLEPRWVLLVDRKKISPAALVLPTSLPWSRRTSARSGHFAGKKPHLVISTQTMVAFHSSLHDVERTLHADRLRIEAPVDSSNTAGSCNARAIAASAAARTGWDVRRPSGDATLAAQRRALLASRSRPCRAARWARRGSRARS